MHILLKVYNNNTVLIVPHLRTKKESENIYKTRYYFSVPRKEKKQANDKIKISKDKEEIILCF